MKRLLMVALVLAAGCRGSTIAEEVVVSGRLSLGFETTSFRPCQSTENWLPVMTPQMHARYDSIAGAMYEPVFARFRGSVGPRGRYGHMGANDRELYVGELLEMRKTAELDCPNTR
ncbi:MAG TPA: hypothetical protein VK420_16630 [Longimicrobium sp.]|jgi:hypothetical protein|nr:hypothetical protein [Longimicrobium sp.]